MPVSASRFPISRFFALSLLCLFATASNAVAQDKKVFKAGESLEVPLNAIHNEGALGDKPAKLIAVYVVEKGKPLVQPAP